MRIIRRCCLIVALLVAPQFPVNADPAKAEDDCYNMAVYYTQRGFAMSPTNTSGLGGAGFTVRLLIPVSKGVDYVILVGRDAAARDLDLYVYDEVGTLILDDRRTVSRAGVKFRSSYSGTVQAYVHMARATGLAAYAVLVGRRGEEKGAPPIPQGPTDFGVAEPSPPR
jgi:hypothetical protein